MKVNLSMRLAEGLAICIVVIALMESVHAQAPPSSVDPHEDPAVQNSDGKKSSGQPVTAPKTPAHARPSKSAVGKIQKTTPSTTARPIEAGEVILGTWNLVIEKSKFNPGPPPKSEVRTYVQTPEGIVATITTVQSDGTKRTISYPWQPDGTERAVLGSELLDTIRLERVDNLTAEATLRHGDKVIASERRTLALDGTSMTITVKDISLEDRPIDIIAVYEKR
jgi:hypothetical protein